MLFRKAFPSRKAQTGGEYGLRSFLFALLTFLLVTGCASSEDIGRIQYDLITLKSEVKDIKGPVTEQTGLSDRVSALEEGQDATRRTISDLFMKMQTLTSEFQVLTGHFEEARYTSEKNIQDLSREREEIMAKLKALEFTLGELEKRLSAQAAVPPSPARPAVSPGTGVPAQPQPDTSPDVDAAPEEGAAGGPVKDVYMNAYRMFKNEKYAESRDSFQSLLEDHEENEYSDNARFWIGETYFREENYEDAILAYEELLKNNPKSEKVPGALLKQGMAFYKLEDRETGNIILEKLVEQYPDSEQAKVARKKLHPATPGKNVE